MICVVIKYVLIVNICWSLNFCVKDSGLLFMIVTEAASARLV